MEKERPFQRHKHQSIAAYILPVLLLVCSSQTVAYAQTLYPDEVDTTLAFTVGPIDITRYELEKNIYPIEKKYIDFHKTPPPPDTLAQWKKHFIENHFFLANAYEKGYFDHAKTKQAVDNVARFMLTQEHGVLYEALVDANLTYSDDDWRQMYEKMDHIYHLDYIKFQNLSEAEGLIEHTSHIDEDIFIFLQQELCDQAEVHCASVQNVWPFPNFWEIKDTIYAMAEHDVSDLLPTSEGTYLMHIKKKEPTPPQSFEDFKKSGSPEYFRFASGRWFMQDYYARIIKQAQPTIEEATERAMTARLETLNNHVVFDKKDFQDMLHHKLVSYTIDSTAVENTVADFLDFYERQVTRTPLTDQASLHTYLLWMVQEEHLYREALRMGLHETPRFTLDRKNYTSKLVLDYYEEQELPIENISNEELRHAYEERIEQFAYPTQAVVSTFVFDKPEDAQQGRADLNAYFETSPQEPFNPTAYPGLLTYTLHDTLTYADADMTYPTELVDRIQQSPFAWIGPLNRDNRYTFLFKEKEINVAYKPLEEVRGIIEHTIRQQRYEVAKAKLLPQLKQTYPLTIYNIE